MTGFIDVHRALVSVTQRQINEANELVVEV
jgi:hypothetical protein